MATDVNGSYCSWSKLEDRLRVVHDHGPLAANEGQLDEAMGQANVRAVAEEGMSPSRQLAVRGSFHECDINPCP